MVKHIVLFRFDDHYSSNEKEDKTKLLTKALLDLKTKIDVIKNMEVNKKAPESQQTNYDLMLLTDFENFKDLDHYRIHPDHVKVVDLINSLNLKRAAIDYMV